MGSLVELSQKKHRNTRIRKIPVNFKISYKSAHGDLPIAKADFILTGLSSRCGIIGESDKMMIEYR